MSLQYDPSLLPGTSGNALSYTFLNHYPNSPSSTTFIVDVSNNIGVFLQVWNIGGGSVNATNGLLIYGFSSPDKVWFDTSPYGIILNLPTVASNIQRYSWELDTGYYQIQLTNMDPSNGINVMATTGLIA